VNQAAVEAAVLTLLEATGDPNLARDDLLTETPKRVARAWVEWFAGYTQDPASILAKSFEDISGYDGIVVLRNIPFHSHCEHHLAQIEGRATVAYLPGGEHRRAVGLSKLARLVHCYARRLQIQERMTAQIAGALMEQLNAAGVGVIVQAIHGCMTTRGVRVHGAQMVTSTMLGRFRENAAARAEALALMRIGD